MKIHRKDKEKLVEFAKRIMDYAVIMGDKVIRAVQGNRETLVYPEDDYHAVLTHMTLNDRLNTLEGLVAPVV